MTSTIQNCRTKQIDKVVDPRMDKNIKPGTWSPGWAPQSPGLPLGSVVFPGLFQLICQGLNGSLGYSHSSSPWN
eukprot:756021-Amphidinium_carterae.2